MISIIIPCYNEERRIGESLEKLGRFCEESFRDYEILVVDDGSADGTSGVVGEIRAYPIRAIRLARNQGKGAAVRAGMLAAKGAYRFFTDADIPYALPAFSSAMEMFRLKGCDLVLGARDLPDSEDRAGTDLCRKAASRIFSAVAGLMFATDIRDSQCGFKGFTDQAATALFTRCTTSGYAFDVEILGLARRLGLRICRIPVTLLVNSHSSIRLPRDGIAMLWQIARIYLRMRSNASHTKPRRNQACND